MNGADKKSDEELLDEVSVNFSFDKPDETPSVSKDMNAWKSS